MQRRWNTLKARICLASLPSIASPLAYFPSVKDTVGNATLQHVHYYYLLL